MSSSNIETFFCFVSKLSSSVMVSDTGISETTESGLLAVLS